MRIVAVEEHFITEAFNVATADNPFTVSKFYRQTIPPLLELGERRLASMDAAGIDVQVLSHTTPGPEYLDAARAVSLSVDANDVAADAIAAHPDRFAAFATLATPDPGAAAKELERAVRNLGFVGGMVNGHVEGRCLDDQFFWPIFEAAEALDVPIYLHPSRPLQALIDISYTGFSPVINGALATGAWGWHIDTGLHVLRMMVAGVFDRFPRLQLIIGHLGEVLPSMIWRADWILRHAGGADPQGVAFDRPVAEYFAENVYVTTSGIFDRAPFAAAVQAPGIDRILFAVDYPYSPNDEGRAFLDKLPVTVEEREKIAHGNSERLLKLGDPAAGNDPRPLQ